MLVTRIKHKDKDMAEVWHEGPEYAVIDEHIGYRIVTPADILAFVDNIKEHELKLLQLNRKMVWMSLL